MYVCINTRTDRHRRTSTEREGGEGGGETGRQTDRQKDRQRESARERERERKKDLMVDGGEESSLPALPSPPTRLMLQHLPDNFVLERTFLWSHVSRPQPQIRRRMSHYLAALLLGCTLRRCFTVWGRGRGRGRVSFEANCVQERIEDGEWEGEDVA